MLVAADLLSARIRCAGALTQYIEHYHRERNHQGKANELLFSLPRRRADPKQQSGAEKDWAAYSGTTSVEHRDHWGRTNILTTRGQGTVAALGELGAVRYGPAISSGGYRFRRWRALQPYAWPGVVYAIILNDHDASVSDLHVRNNFGSALQAGAECGLSRKWGLFADNKQIWLGVDAHGFVGNAPVTAHVKTNPTLFSTGLKYHF